MPWRIKQRRADEHIREFANACRRYLEDAHVGLCHDSDPAKGIIRVRFEADFEPPAELGAIIGDILHNLRSALDAVAWETCRRAGVLADEEKNVYFPVSADAERWSKLVRRQLPAVEDAQHLEVFRRLQPWFWDEEVKALGVNDFSDAAAHPLARLNELAKVDRHRVPHPVLARAGDSWLGGPDGVSVRLASAPAQHAKPGQIVLEWQVDPPQAVTQFEPGGEAILVLSDEAADHRSSAVGELQAMQQSVIEATRTIEVDVLGIVSTAEMDELGRLAAAARAARRSLDTLRDTRQVIDADYIDRYSRLAAELEAATAAHLDRWRELFD